MILKRQEKDTIIKALYDSSNVLASTYDTESCDLTIIFKSGTQYKYSNVSKSDYMRFEIAESQGKVFNTHIKKYAFEKLDNFTNVNLLVEELDKLKKQEETALIDAKRLELTNMLSYLYHLTQKDRNEEVDTVFNQYLPKLKTLIDDFLTEVSSNKTLE